MSTRDWWGVVHGMGLGALFLLSFAGCYEWLKSYRADLMSPVGLERRRRRMIAYVWSNALLCWLTAVTGTFVVYPWYRAEPPAGADLHDYPRSFLLSSPGTAVWHDLGMEWKEHVAWLAPILATALAFAATRAGTRLATDAPLRRALIATLVLAFLAAAIAGVGGAFLTRVAPL